MALIFFRYNFVFSLKWIYGYKFVYVLGHFRSKLLPSPATLTIYMFLFLLNRRASPLPHFLSLWFFIFITIASFPSHSFSATYHRLKQPSPFSSSSFLSSPFQAAVTFSSFGFFLVVQAVLQLPLFQWQQDARMVPSPVIVVTLSFHRPPFPSFGSTGNQQHTPSSVTRFARHHHQLHLASFFPCWIRSAAAVTRVEGHCWPGSGGRGEAEVAVVLLKNREAPPLSNGYKTELLFLVKFTVIEDFLTPSFPASICRSVPVSASIFHLTSLVVFLVDCKLV